MIKNILLFSKFSMINLYILFFSILRPKNKMAVSLGLVSLGLVSFRIHVR